VKCGGGNKNSPDFAISLPSQPFLGCHLGFFSQWPSEILRGGFQVVR